MKQTAVVFVGMPGSGKTSAAEACKSLGLRVYTSSVIIREAAKDLDLKQTDENLAKVSGFFHQDHLDWLISELEEDIRTKKKIFVVEGLRSIEQVNLLKKKFKTVVISVICSKKERFKRLFKRERSDDPKIMKDLEKRDKREVRRGLRKTMQKSKYEIDNTDMSPKKFEREVRKLVRKIFKL